MSARDRCQDGKLAVMSYVPLRRSIERYLPTARALPGAKLPDERFQLGHLVESVLAWFAGQSDPARDEIVLNGREMVRLIRANPDVDPVDLAAVLSQRRARQKQPSAVALPVWSGSVTTLDRSIPDRGLAHGDYESAGAGRRPKS